MSKLEKIKETVFEKPLLASIIIMFVTIAFTFAPISFLFRGIVDEQSAGYMAGIIEQVLVSIILISLIKKIHLLEQAGFTKHVKSIWLIWPMLIFIFLMGSEYLTGEKLVDLTHPLRIILFILLYLSTGLFEEALCRGLVFNLLLNKWKEKSFGPYGALLLSSLLFGMVHFVHFILGDASLLATLTQVTYATFIGVFFGACVVRNKNIYPAMILHGLVDIVGDLGEVAVGGGIDKFYISMSVSGAVGCIILTLPLFIYGMFIVRKEFKACTNRKEGHVQTA